MVAAKDVPGDDLYPQGGPEVAIVQPVGSPVFAQGQSVTFSGTAEDPEDGDLSATLEWTSSVDGPVGTGASVTTSTLSVGTHTITTAVTDSGGLPGSDTITLWIVDGEGFTARHLSVDFQPIVSDGNRVFEPGETVKVAPSWHNDTTSTQSLTGTASGFSGPAGAIYTVAYDAADYGTFVPAEIRTCLTRDICYHMEVNDPDPRPTTHWDAMFDETLSDDTLKPWTLHIGESFTDVPRTHQLYWWIEVLLHSKVTSGCTADTYCPASANTRGQMAVFLLKALEGSGYVPPACVEGAEGFADVPASSQYCPWIEELASRGVTSGCGDGNYCPGNAVTRAQMAVFLLKTLEGPDYAPPTCTGVFADVACPSRFVNWVEELWALGVSRGCGNGNYCPAAAVTRAQMAVLLAKTFRLAVLYGPLRVARTPPEDETDGGGGSNY